MTRNWTMEWIVSLITSTCIESIVRSMLGQLIKIKKNNKKGYKNEKQEVFKYSASTV